MARCPICKNLLAPGDPQPNAPFCSERCRMVDLGKWFGEAYRVPAEEVPDESELDADGAGGDGQRLRSGHDAGDDRDA